MRIDTTYMFEALISFLHMRWFTMFIFIFELNVNSVFQVHRHGRDALPKACFGSVSLGSCQMGRYVYNNIYLCLLPAKSIPLSTS